jgi:hypothetical protein
MNSFSDSTTIRHAFTCGYLKYGKPDRQYVFCHVVTPIGMVSVYAEAGHMRFDVVHNKRLRMLNINGLPLPSERSVAIRAHKFIKEVVEKKTV